MQQQQQQQQQQQSQQSIMTASPQLPRKENFYHLGAVAGEEVQDYIDHNRNEEHHAPSIPDAEDMAPHEITSWSTRLGRIGSTLKGTFGAITSHLSHSDEGGDDAVKTARGALIDNLYDRVCGLDATSDKASPYDIAALFIWSVLAKHDSKLHHRLTPDKYVSMEQKLLSLAPDTLAAVRDAVDVLSEGLGFLPLVLASGSERFYRGLVAILKRETKPAHLPLKIFSDIDDTYHAGWLDTPIGQVYEGVQELYSDLLRCRNPASVVNSQVQMVFLSARPKGKQAESAAELKLKGAGFPVPGRFVVLYGKVFADIIAAIDTHEMAQEKVNMFRLYRGLYPHFLYFFFGDTGQGDAEAGEMMFNLTNPADRPIAVFLHEVRPADKPRPRKLGDGFVYVENYQQARTKCVERGYLI